MGVVVVVAVVVVVVVVVIVGVSGVRSNGISVDMFVFQLQILSLLPSLLLLLLSNMGSITKSSRDQASTISLLPDL